MSISRLDHIGRGWTLCDWVQTDFNLNPPDYVRERLCYELHEVPNLWRKLCQAINRLVISKTIITKRSREAS
jgi:hypothetical protein